MNAADYNALSNFVVIPAGTNEILFAITPKQDTAVEGDETVKLSLFENTGYRIGPSTNVTALVRDDETNAPPLSLRFVSPATGNFQLTLSGPATRAYELEGSTTLTNWQRFATLVTGTNTSVRLLDTMETNYLFFRARELQ